MSDGKRFRRGKTVREVRPWAQVFAHAVRGVLVAAGREVNFVIHGAAAVCVIALGAWLELSLERFALLGLCITLVMTAEMVNTAIEHLARAITQETNPEIRDALDVASGAVLVATIGAAVVGLIVLGQPLLERL